MLHNISMLAFWSEFFEELEFVRGRSKNTIQSYRRDLELYESFLKKHKDIHYFYAFMKGQGLSDRSQARVISSLRTYFKFCESKGKDSPELRSLKLPKVKKTIPKTITPAQFEMLFQAAAVPQETLKTERNQLVLLLLFGLGCRVTELIQIELNDVDLQEGYVKILGKGNKERLVPLTESLLTKVKVYLEEARPSLVKNKTVKTLLVNERGKALSRIDIWRWLAAWSQRAGFKEVIHPHQLRHACATTLLEQGADLRSIQILLGHTSIQTTQVYTQVTTRKLNKEVDAKHPLSHYKD
ncbi:MAG: tyrosine-type recombinase/integrase [Bdellovibrionaceae bacterium]|nr:tyrosine-type recombinase/integrase [Pseudobdellovibrionaceae bacterium]